jgi:hypothetical protein
MKWVFTIDVVIFRDCVHAESKGKKKKKDGR